MTTKVKTTDGEFGQPVTVSLKSVYKKLCSGDNAGYHRLATDIQVELKKRLRAADVPNLKQLTVTLRQHGFIYGSVNSRRGWFVKLRDERNVR